MIGNHVYNEDCLDTMFSMPDGHVDLVVTSPPYDDMRTYGGHTFDFGNVSYQLARVLKPGGVIVWVVGDQTVNGSESGTSFRQALAFMELGLNLHDTMIYDKGVYPYGNSGGYWQAFEYMFIFSKGKPMTLNLIRDRPNKSARGLERATKRKPDGTMIDRKTTPYGLVGRRTNIWSYRNGRNVDTKDLYADAHPAKFPEALARDHIITWSNPGDLVYDPFCGSGTVPKMCIETGRKWIASEINPDYMPIIERRVREAGEQSRLEVYNA